uniref:Uncharacterized protein n=1 Tax=Romanomermis culicivorax TaxID=13658 RepID=A0A915HFF5_ROMCU
MTVESQEQGCLESQNDIDENKTTISRAVPRSRSRSREISKLPVQLKIPGFFPVAINSVKHHNKK